MSARSRPLEVDIDLDDGVATVDLFEDDECRLWADEAGWRGFRREDGIYCWVDTRYAEELDLSTKVRVSEGAVQTTIRAYLESEPVAAPHGRVTA